jgi:hypothetical protein
MLIICKKCKKEINIQLQFGQYTQQFLNSFICYNCYTKEQIEKKKKAFGIELL